MTKKEIMKQFEELGVKFVGETAEQYMKRHHKDYLLDSLESTKNYLKSLGKERF